MSGAGDAWPAVAAIAPDGDDASLLALVTDPDRRRQGLGTRLLDGVANDLRASGLGRLHAQVAGVAGDAGAEAWLRRRGFRPTVGGCLELIL